MLTIRMQRTGRKGYATFRVVVQDSRFTPTSGRIVESIGHYNPHTKETQIDVAKAEAYLANGAQPTPRVVKILTDQKATLPAWVEMPTTDKKNKVKNAEKLRKNQPKEEVAETPVEEPAASEETTVSEEPTTSDEPTQEVEATETEKVESAEEVAEPVAEKEAEEVAEAEKPAEA